MIRLYQIVLLLGLTLVLQSCFKEDEPLDPYKSPPGVFTGMAETKKDYSMQTYYDLETNQFVASNHRSDWDIMLSAAEGSFAIYLNSAKKMRAYNTQSTDLNVVVNLTDTAVVKWKYDESTGSADSTAIGKWGQPSGNTVVSDQYVYIIDRGFTPDGIQIGYQKLRINSFGNNKYSITIANVDGSNAKELELVKNSGYNFLFVSFNEGGKQVIIEPPKDSYDLLFTQYTTRVYYENFPKFEWYSVNGTLLNPSGEVEMARDTVTAFENIDANATLGYTYSKLWDAMGYNWKSYNIDLGVYTILTYRVFIIRNRKGNYYKMRFVGFTNNQGDRGYPTFEVSKI